MVLLKITTADRIELISEIAVYVQFHCSFTDHLKRFRKHDQDTQMQMSIFIQFECSNHLLNVAIKKKTRKMKKLFFNFVVYKISTSSYHRKFFHS